MTCQHLLQRSSYFYSIFGALVFTVFLTSQIASAAVIDRVRGNRVLINLDGEPARIGDIYFVVNSSGRRSGVLKIMRISGNQAIAVLGRGQAESGWTLQAREESSPQTPSPSSPPPPVASTSSSYSNFYIGGTLGYSMDSMQVALVDTSGTKTGVTADMSGSSIDFKGLLDYQVFSPVWFRGSAGMQNFEAQSGTTCPSNTACNIKISYLSFDFWGRFLFSEKQFRPWVGLGFSLLFPMSKSSTAVAEQTISNNNLLSVGGGLDYFFSERMFVPVQLEYNMFPDSAQVKANFMAIRAGFGMTF